MSNDNFRIRKAISKDIEELNNVYHSITGFKRTSLQTKWEWFTNKKKLGWVIIFKNKIIGHHGYIEVPMILNNKRFLILRTENSMLLEQYRRKVPYFLIEKNILKQLRKKYKLFLTTAGKNAPIDMRYRLGYEKLESWQILIINNHILHKINTLKKAFFFFKKKKIETKESILKSSSYLMKIINLNPKLKVLCDEAKKNMKKNILSIYPSEKYFHWRFFINPYHNYFSLILNINESKKKIVIVWYEMAKSENLYDIIIEYLSFPSELNLKDVLNKIALLFNHVKNCRLIYRKILTSDTERRNETHANLLAYFSDTSLKKYNIEIDSAARQGIHS